MENSIHEGKQPRGNWEPRRVRRSRKTSGAGFALWAIAGTWALSGCVPDVVLDVLEPRDLVPASVTAWESTASREYRVEFNEEVAAVDGSFSAVPALGALEVSAVGGILRIVAESDAAPGAPVAVEGTVRDASGNTTSFVLPFWGYNPRLPRIVINEVLTQGSAAHPNVVELRTLEAGNLAGLTFLVGSLAQSSNRYIFPACEVSSGEYIVLHLKPQGVAEEVDETEGTVDSGGLDAMDGARDFWYPGDDGALPGENGAVTLYGSPTGRILDALLYSCRFSDSDTKYSGFGSRALLDQATEITASGAWTTSTGSVRPEDAARSAAVTSTRTLCRSSDSGDTDSGADWHVVPTRGSTIGTTNSDEVYAP